MHSQCYSLAPIEKAWRGRSYIDGSLQGWDNIFAIFINEMHAHLFCASLCATELDVNDSEEKWVRSWNLCGIYRVEADTKGTHLSTTLVGIIAKKSEVNFQCYPLCCCCPSLGYFKPTGLFPA